MTFTLPQGSYRFRGDLNGTQFWSGVENHCTMPGCSSAIITLPGGNTSRSAVTINYTYDGLSRLTAADYSSGDYYHYAYDAVGNRLTETTPKGETAYTYDPANRLTSVNGQAVQWDDNGNMLADGQAVYKYNTANKLVGVAKGTSNIVYAYSGLGDRLKQIADGITTDYTLDINAGLTQVLQDGKQTYLYGNQRISQIAETQTGYFLPDALGSMRQMTDSSADLTLARSYDPYGNVVSSSGAGETVYGYTGEMQSGGLVHLRARDYASQLGRFTSRDTWEGVDTTPLSYNKWMYVEGNPINNIDPIGKFPDYCHKLPDRIQFEDCVRKAYKIDRPREYDHPSYIYPNDSPGCHYEVSPRFPISYAGEGYVEGKGTIWFGSMQGQHEVVFDFANMTSARFDISGYEVSDTIPGIGIYLYAGIVGYPQYLHRGFSSVKTIEQDYSGPFIFYNIGLSVPTEAPIIPAPGIFASSYSGISWNPIGGVNWGIGLTDSLDLLPIADLGAGWNSATIVNEPVKSYTYSTGDGKYKFVNDSLLMQDIFNDSRSPWSEGGITNSFVNPLAYIRLYPLSQMRRWADIYKDLNNGE